MKKTLGGLGILGLASRPLSGAVALVAVGAGFSLGLGLGLGLGMGVFAGLRRDPPVTPREQGEVADLRPERAKLAQRADQLDHDLRTPIGTIATALEWMSTTLDEPDSQTEARQVIGRQVSRLIVLTDELHELAQQLGR